MANEFDYYKIGCEYFGNVPLLQCDGEHDIAGVSFLSQSRTVSSDYVAYITFNPPIPSKPRLADAMSLDGTCNVFSKKIFDILSQYSIKGLQLVPTVIRGKNGEKFDNYWIANIYQEMAFFDEEETEYEYIDDTGAWQDIEKIVLDKDKMASVPLENRLVFVSKENCAFVLYHKSVVDIIMSANPEGIVFTPIEEWSDEF